MSTKAAAVDEHGAAKTCIGTDMRVFIDTNLLGYQFDKSNPVKRRTTTQFLASDHDFVVSTQVLVELYHVLARKFRNPLPHDHVQLIIGRLAQGEVVPTDHHLVLSAIETAGRHQLSMWDALILEAAAISGCEELWTEDLNTGATLRGVRIVNPLLDT